MSPDNNSGSAERSRWTSLYIVYAATFYSILQDAIYWTLLWPYLQRIDPEATESFYGAVVVGQNVAAMISAVFYGYWANKAEGTKWPVVFGVSLMVIGNGVLVFSDCAALSPRYWVLGGRLISGLGMGCSGTLTAYVTMATTLEERGKAISSRFALQSAASVIGPPINLAFYPLKYPGISLGPIRLNVYTAAGWFNVVTGIIVTLALVVCFKESWISVADAGSDNDYSDIDWRAVIACMFLRFSVYFGHAFASNAWQILSILMFEWWDEATVLYNGIINAVISVISIAANLVVGHRLMRSCRERTLISIGCVAMISGYVVSFAYPTLVPLVPHLDPNTTTNVSCEYAWCPYTSRVHLAQYLVTRVIQVFFMTLAGMPASVLFSKILGGIKQATMQSVFSATAQLAYVIGPVSTTAILQAYGPRAAWAMGGTVALAGTTVFVVSFPRMLPFGEYKSTRRSSNTSTTTISTIA